MHQRSDSNISTSSVSSPTSAKKSKHGHGRRLSVQLLRSSPSNLSLELSFGKASGSQLNEALKKSGNTAQELYLGSSNLDHLPHDLRYMMELKLLDGSFNKLTTLPDEEPVWTTLGRTLIVLDLRNNMLTSLPSKLSYCQHLAKLILFKNELHV